jgi:hypothetical protein
MKGAGANAVGGRANEAVRGIERRSTMKSLTFSVEVITVPVSNVDRAIRFYAHQVGFTIDVDYAPSDSFRVVQLTPPGSSCSLQIGKGLTDAPAGSLRNAHLVVSDLQVARSRLLERGVRVGEIRIGIGAAVTRRPLPHHRAYGSVHGGSSRLR